MQPCQLQTLKDTVREPLHIGIGLNHLLTSRQLTANQIAFPWGEEAETISPDLWPQDQGQRPQAGRGPYPCCLPPLPHLAGGGEAPQLASKIPIGHRGAAGPGTSGSLPGKGGNGDNVQQLQAPSPAASQLQR